APFTLLGVAFTKFGFNTPSHQVRPPTSLNYDLSLEKHFKGTDISFKLTPFVRKTKDQIQQFFLDQATSFVSGLNVGRQTSEGFEFQLNKGDFSRNGLSGQLSFAYTHSYINYDVLNNGTTLTTGINSDIKNYNAYTSFCASNPSNAKCGTTSTGATAAACYTPAGVADPGCAAGDIANPYWNAPAQGLIDPNQNFPTYDLFPGPIGSAATTYGAPYVGTLILNYKHDKWAVTPSLQFVGGARYGSPETNAGIDPASGCTALASSTTGDPRYPYGAAGGSPFDSTGCGGTLNAIPNSYTGTFDPLGAFLQPSQLIGNVQVSYEVSPKLSLVGTFANVLNRCWGGTKAAWTINDSNVCSYGLVAGGFEGGVGNVYNPGNTLERGAKYPYGAYLGAVNVDGNSTKTPFNFFIEARIKL
ncbi:MAG TPA: TonB-dependent receptor, partial [Candidatus Baltobacteraceae bacterium]